MTPFIDWREFSKRDKIKRLPIYEQKRLYFLEMQKQQYLNDIMTLQEHTPQETNPVFQQGWAVAPQSGPGAAAGSPGYQPPTDDINDYCVNDYVESYFVLADPIHY